MIHAVKINFVPKVFPFVDSHSPTSGDGRGATEHDLKLLVLH